MHVCWFRLHAPRFWGVQPFPRPGHPYKNFKLMFMFVAVDMHSMSSRCHVKWNLTVGHNAFTSMNKILYSCDFSS